MTTNPYLPNPGAALATSAELGNLGARLTGALEDALGRINAVGDPWGNDEPGQAYRASIGDTTDVQQALRGVGQGVTGFGSIATSGIGQILEVDRQSGRSMVDIRI